MTGRQDEKLYKLFGLNDLSAHYLVIVAGSLESFQEMNEDERTRRFSDVIGSGRIVRMSVILKFPMQG